jgi:hypothetical protein
MSKQSMLQETVDSKFVPVYMTNYDQVKDYYQDQYGDRGWIGKMAEAVAGRNTSVPAKQDKPYLAARRSIERYEAGKFKSMKTYGGKMAGVGRSLPPIGKTLPGNEIKITVRGTQNEGKSGTRDRNISVTFKGSDAYSFANNPTYADIWNEYGVNPDLFEEGDYAIEVEAVS